MPPGGPASRGRSDAAHEITRRGIRSFARRIVRAPLTKVEGVFCRAVRSEYLRRRPPAPLHYHASAKGARYTPRDGPAGLYLATDQPTAFAEIQDLAQGSSGRPLPLVPRDPVTLVSVDVKLDRVLDLTDSTVRRALRISGKAIAAEWRPRMAAYRAGAEPMPLTQQIGEAAHLSGEVRGILYPSARWDGGRNLVVFPDRLTTADRVDSYDPTGVLSQRLAPVAP